MKAHKIISVISVLAMLLALMPVVSASAAAEKVAVCHVDEFGVYHMITISMNAFDSHVAHGDTAPGEWVPSKQGAKFASDCSVITIPQKTLVDTLTVTSTGQIVSWSTVSLTAGQAYELKASGVYRFANWGSAGIADAKYSLRTAAYNPYGTGTAWVNGADLNADSAKAYGLQVTLFDGNTDKPLTRAGWVETYNDAHIYTAPYTGTGAALGLFIWDDIYTDNVGSITVEIYQINW